MGEGVASACLSLGWLTSKRAQLHSFNVVDFEVVDFAFVVDGGKIAAVDVSSVGDALAAGHIDACGQS